MWLRFYFCWMVLSALDGEELALGRTCLSGPFIPYTTPLSPWGLNLSPLDTCPFELSIALTTIPNSASSALGDAFIRHFLRFAGDGWHQLKKSDY